MAATRTRTRPAVRLRPVPPLEPPYDDELTLVAWTRDYGDQLELDFPAGPGGSLRPGTSGSVDRAGRGPGPGSTTGPEAGTRAGAAGRPGVGPPGPDGPAGPARGGATATVEAQRAARRFLDTCLEIFNGYRPVAHARALTGPGLAADLVEQLRTGAERLPRPARPGDPAAGRLRLRLRMLRVCEPRPGIAEAAAAVGNAERTWALAFRLERRRNAWWAALAQVL